MRFTVVIERTHNNYAAYVPDLLGCIATAKTREALLEEIREAIEFHIEGMREDGEPVPEPRATTLTRRFAPPSPRGRGSDCRTDEPKRCAAPNCGPHSPRGRVSLRDRRTQAIRSTKLQARLSQRESLAAGQTNPSDMQQEASRRVRVCGRTTGS